MDITPSAFTPFFRRFTDEKARDLDDTRRLYERVRSLHLTSHYAEDDAETTFGGNVYATVSERLSEPLQPVFIRLIAALISGEKVIFELPSLNFDVVHLSLNELVDLRHFLRAKEHFLAHEDRVIDLLGNGLSNIVGALANLLPETWDPPPFTVPLIYLLPEPKKFLDNLYGELWQQRYVDNGLFVEASRRMYFNICEESGIVDPQDPKKPFKHPSKNDKQLCEIVEAYLKGTPFYEFFLAPVPLKFTHEDRFSHMHVLGGSGAGKTTLLQNLILHDLRANDLPSMVIVDSQGDLINKLSHLEMFSPDGGALHDRLLIISPKDIKAPPAINIFDVNRERLDQYDEAAKEQVVAGVIQTFDYVFSGLIGADLTAKQGVFFRFVARLMLSLPETLGRTATILDIIALMDDPVPYRAAIEALPPIQRNFFERDFASKTFAQTKEQIRYRLNAILENPTLARLFTSPRTKIDLFERLNEGSIILVDTAKDFLKGASAHFGRIMISQVLQAVLERAVIPEWDRKPTFLIVDEAASYFDSNIDDFLTEARKYKCGCVFAHQFLDQATSSLRASLAANTSIKLASGVSNSDARAVASDMRTTADFILSQPRLHFAAHIRNVTPNAVSIPVPVGQLEREPRMSEAAYRRLRALNGDKVSIPAAERNAGFPPRPVPDASAATSPSMTEKPHPPLGTKSDPSAPSEDW
ncbi:MAG: type IV secretion system DNA-binding domain-containing protein [Rhizomicrobium sp.]